MLSHHLPTLIANLPAPWHEFLRTPSMSMGLYHLKAGDHDTQSPHTEDEAYYVLSGRATFHCGAESIPAIPGQLLYVDRHVPHHFTNITQDLTLLVIFAPPEHSLKPTT